jgi:hypothetical protein
MTSKFQNILIMKFLVGFGLFAYLVLGLHPGQHILCHWAIPPPMKVFFINKGGISHKENDIRMKFYLQNEILLIFSLICVLDDKSTA